LAVRHADVVTYDLRHHGDAEVRGDLINLAVNVRHAPMPGWLSEPIADAMTRLSAYPDHREATEAIARRHGRDPAEVLLTAGASQGFVVLAQAFRGANRPVVVHPQFTEPEAALSNAGHQVHRVLLREQDGFRLDARAIPADSELVFLGNPVNPTSTLTPAAEIEKLIRPGRTVVVDEAFADTIEGEPESMSTTADMSGLVILRSLTKTWGLAGLRIGYVLADRKTIGRLGACLPLWPVSAPALAAAAAIASPVAVMHEREIARRLSMERSYFLGKLRKVPGVAVPGDQRSSFVCVRIDGAAKIRLELRERGWAVRRGDTFPGLGPDWLRIAVRDTATTDAFIEVLTDVIKEQG
jgi:histidinol-phosphate aminotransferase